MKHLLLLLCVGFSLEAFSQSEFIQKPTSGMSIPTAPQKSLSLPLNNEKVDFSKFSTNTPTYSKWDTSSQKNVDIIQKKEFVNPGDLQKKKMNEGEVNLDPNFKSDRYLGDFRNNGKFVRFVCRDFGEVDGDRVRVYLNDQVVQEEIFLEGVYKAVTINLVPGFNKIEFQALNQGTSGPNTAEFKMFDDQGALISSNQWNLATGVRATLIVVKE